MTTIRVLLLLGLKALVYDMEKELQDLELKQEQDTSKFFLLQFIIIIIIFRWRRHL